MNFDQTTLNRDLENYRLQFEAIKMEAQDLLAGLDEARFNWRPSPDQWSVAQCIDHLITTGRSSLSNIHHALNEARSEGAFSPGPFRYGLWERWFVRLMEPPPKWKFKAPSAYAPSTDRAYTEAVPEFLGLQDEFLHCLDEANGIDLSKTKVRNPASRWIRFSLGQELALNAAHERRHLWQIRQIKGATSFP
jgi:hypothetical protein